MSAPEIVSVIDLKTTGLDPQSDHITEIAAIRAEVSADGSIREIGRFQTFVALPPGVEAPPEIAELTGIKAEDLRGAPWAFAAATALDLFANGSVVVAHNFPFDAGFITRANTFGADFLRRGFACTRAMTRLVDPGNNASLAPTCARYGIALNGHHRAMNDVEATLQVYAALRSLADESGIPYRNVVIDSEERPLKYVPPGAIVRTINRTKESA